ncbi:MAG TPA: branched-chain amino acid ABC transporter substrate-binding protein [Burkholderiales bacterium]|nr:branched-chain amino acid ABC transporter substrate-binding protein [Burkholderiales bacterium]
MQIVLARRVAAALALLFLAPLAVAAEPVRIAVITPLSGSFALSGEEVVRQFRGIADLVNARGGAPGGRPVEIVPLDGKASVQDSLLALKQATDQHISFVATHISSVALALSDAVSKHNERNPDRRVLLLTFDARDPVLTEEKCSFWQFRFGYHTTSDVNFMTDYLARQPGPHRVYLLNQDYAYGQAVSRTAKEMLAAKRPDIEIVGDEFVPLGKVKDFTPYVAKIRAARADSVITGNWGTDLALFVRAAHEAGLKARFYTFVAYAAGAAQGFGAAGENRVWGVFPWIANSTPNPYEKYNAEFRAKYRSTGNFDYVIAYRVVEMLAAAIGRARSTDPAKVAAALEGMRYDGAGGESWMRAEDHQIIAPLYLASFVKAGQPGVKFDQEDTGFGWKLEAKVDAKDAVPEMKCRMQRP